MLVSLVLLLWGAASALVGLTVAATFGWLHRQLHRKRRYEKPDLDIIFVTFTLIASPIVPFVMAGIVGTIEQKLTKVHVLKTVTVYADPKRRHAMTSLMPGDPVVFLGGETGKDYYALCVRLPDGRDGYIGDHGRVKVVSPW